MLEEEACFKMSMEILARGCKIGYIYFMIYIHSDHVSVVYVKAIYVYTLLNSPNLTHARHTNALSALKDLIGIMFARVALLLAMIAGAAAFNPTVAPSKSAATW